MTRDEVEEYEQDNLGNVSRKIDTIRAQEGMSAETDSGILIIGSADTGGNLVVYTPPTHADEYYLSEIHVRNSAGSAGDYYIQEATLDSGGSITGTTRRSIDYNVASGADETQDYGGEAFTDALAVNSDFGGQVGVEVIVDHNEATEPENTIE